MNPVTPHTGSVTCFLKNNGLTNLTMNSVTDNTGSVTCFLKDNGLTNREDNSKYAIVM
jgi:hypothetical protein